MSRIVIASLSPDSSSSLPRFLGNALEQGNDVTHAFPRESRLRKYLLMALTFHPSRMTWRNAFERESQHRIRVWHDSTAQLQAMASVRESDVILQEGLHFDAVPPGYRGKFALYLHGTLSMVLDRTYFDCSMWRPPEAEIPAWSAAERAVLARADRIFVGAKFMLEILEKTYGIPREKIRFVGTGQPPLANESAAPPAYNASNRILFVGKDFERKGGEYLVRAFSEVAAKIPTARLQIVGPRKLSVAPHPGIEFIGRVNDRQRLTRLFREAAVFAMPSLHESFGFVFLEAMNAGLPCVGANLFAMPEIIEHERTGLIVPPAEHHQLAQALIRILSNPEEAARMGAAGREHQRKNFVWKSVGDGILDGLGLRAHPPAGPA